MSWNYQREQAKVDDWNANHPIGTEVRYWRGFREGDGQTGRTRSRAALLGGHTAVVWIDNTTGCIGLTHVEPLTRYEVASEGSDG